MVLGCKPLHDQPDSPAPPLRENEFLTDSARRILDIESRQDEVLHALVELDQRIEHVLAVHAPREAKRGARTSATSAPAIKAA